MRGCIDPDDELLACAIAATLSDVFPLSFKVHGGKSFELCVTRRMTYGELLSLITQRLPAIEALVYNNKQLDDGTPLARAFKGDTVHVFIPCSKVREHTGTLRMGTLRMPAQPAIALPHMLSREIFWGVVPPPPPPSHPL